MRRRRKLRRRGRDADDGRGGRHGIRASDRTITTPAANPRGNPVSIRCTFDVWIIPSHSSATVVAIGMAESASSVRAARAESARRLRDATVRPAAPDRYNPKHRAHTGS